MEYLAEAVNSLLEAHCQSVAEDEWDLDGLVKELKTFWPNDITTEQLDAAGNTDKMYDLVMADASNYYEKREAELGSEVMRDVERQVMLRIIDQRWREHLEEMDYLQEGINLRAMGQVDPLTEWQREGFDMFGAMMKGIAQDFVRYVMHVQVIRQDAAPAPVQNVQQTSSEDAPTGGGFASAASAGALSDEDQPAAVGAARRSPSSRPSSRTSGRRPHATRPARAAAARSSRCATVGRADGRHRSASDGRDWPPLRFGCSLSDGRDWPPLRFGCSLSDGRDWPPLRFGCSLSDGRDWPPLRFGCSLPGGSPLALPSPRREQHPGCVTTAMT